MTEVLTNPVKSPNDENSYRHVELKNGLKVFLIQHPHDEESSKKLAALCLFIDVGGYHDPPEAKGLAHLLEHMAFMGSEKYPKENEYHQYINNNGGSLNAMTGFLETIYFFTVVEQGLEGALDRFASIFIAPLISESSIEREIDSVESEFQGRRNNDYIRQRQIVYAATKEGTPFNAFLPGNISTFRANGRTNAQLYEMLHEHRRQFYVANRMSLAVQSSMDLDELQTLVENYFNDIESGEPKQKTTDDMYKDIFDHAFSKKLIYIKPKSEMMKLTLFIPLPSTSKHYKTQPLHYLAKLLEDEYEGGLISYLKKKLLITSVYVNISATFGDDPLVSTLFLDFEMTAYGSTHVEEILSALYSYLLLLKETPMEKHKDIFGGLKSIADRKFEFLKAGEADENVNKASQILRVTSAEDVLRAELVYIEYNEDAIKKYIELLNEPNYFIMIMNNQLVVDYNETEKYFGAEFCRMEMPESFQRAWTERKLMTELQLPPTNEFICNNFDIYSVKEGVEGTRYPEKIFENDAAETWYKLDSKFKLPYGHVDILLTSPMNFNSPFNHVLTKLYVSIISRFLDEKLAAATQVGFNFSVDVNEEGILTVKLSGYNEKLSLLTDIVTKEMKKFNEYLDESIFDVYKTERTDSYKNALKQGYFVTNLKGYFMCLNFPHKYELYKAIQGINVEHLEKFVEKFFNKLNVKILILGNISRDEAHEISNIIMTNITPLPITHITDIEQKSFKLPKGKRTTLKLKSFHGENQNSFVIEIFDLGERSMRKDCTIELLNTILDEPAFDILRTKEQLAYTVRVSKNITNDSIYFYLYIISQENVHPAREIAARLWKFARVDMKEILESLSDEAFGKIQDSLANAQLIPFTELADERKFYLDQITDNYYMFNRKEKKAEMFRKISKQEIIDFYNAQ